MRTKVFAGLIGFMLVFLLLVHPTPTQSWQSPCDIDVPASDTTALISAINAANANGTPDTICLGGGTYTLTAINNSNSDGTNGLPAITSEITITGSGATITRSGSATFRFFYVTESGTLTLDNLTLSNGQISGTNPETTYVHRGGAVDNRGTLTLQRVTLANNTSVDGGAGAIYTEGSANLLTILNSTFLNNTAQSGGGGAVGGAAYPLTIQDSDFEGNTADGSGGAISTSGLTSISGSTFRNNSAIRGGAVYSTIKDMSVDSSLFEQNSASTAGGAIYGYSNAITVTQSRFLYNTAQLDPYTNTGAIRTDEGLYTASWRGVLYMSESCVVGNSPPAVWVDGRESDVSGNWWGAVDGPSGYGSGNGDQLSMITGPYTPFLTTPPDGCPALPPIAQDQSFDALYQSPNAIPLVTVGGLPPYTYAVTQPAHGTIISDGSSPVTYTPEAGFKGTDAFEFTVTDSAGGSDSGVVNITIVSDVKAVSQKLYTPYNTPLDLTLQATGSFGPFTFSDIAASHGTVSGTPPDLTYTPTPGQTGYDAILFTVTDSAGFTAPGGITIYTAPLLRMSSQDLYYGDEPLQINLGVSGGRMPYTFTMLSDPQHGALSPHYPYYVTYALDDGYTGVDSFDLQIVDANGTTLTAMYRISTAAPLVTTTLDYMVTAYETPLLITLSAAGGFTPYSYTIDSELYHGTLSGTAPNLTYTPDADYIGSDYFNFTVYDAYGFSASDWIHITVREPLSLDDQYVITSFETPVDVTLSAYGGLPPYTYAIASDPTNGALSLTGDNLTYTPDTDFVGDDSFTVQVTDFFGYTATATITVTVEPPPPLVIADQTVDVSFETPRAITVQADGGVAPLNYVISDPAHGTLTGTIPDLTYTPDPDFGGADAFTVQVTDRWGATVQATISITVHAAHIAAGDVDGLIAAINAANADAWPDTILLTPSTFTLTAINNTDDDGSNGLPIITTEIAIRGSGATITRGGTDYFRFFAVASTGTLTLDDLTLTNGNNRLGGAIFNQGTLTVRDSTLSQNISGADTIYVFYGGAIYSAPSGTSHSLTITNTTFDHNTAYGLGGALYVSGSSAVEITGSTFSANQALQVHSSYGYFGYGGAIYTRTPLMITATSFTGNQATAGAALFAEITQDDKTITITDSLFDGNHVATGTAITIKQGEVYITDSILINHANIGPGGTSVLRTTTDYTANHASMIGDCIVNNDGLALYEALNYAGIYAQRNWWGAADGPTLDTGSPLGSGQLVDADVDYTNFLTAPPMPGCPVMPPVVDTQSLHVLSGDVLPITLTARGGLPPYTFSDISTPAHGTLSGTAPDLIYTPDAGYDGPDAFTFTVTDSVGGTATGTVEITVELPIQAFDQALSTDQNVLLDVTLSSSGGIPPYIYTVTSQPAHGVLVKNAPDLSYIPDENYLGADTLIFEVHDAQRRDRRRDDHDHGRSAACGDNCRRQHGSGISVRDEW